MGRRGGARRRRVEFVELPLLERDGAGDGEERLREAAGPQHLELAEHAAGCPLALMLPTAGLREELRCRFSECSTRDTPEDGVADHYAVLAASCSGRQGRLVSLRGLSAGSLALTGLWCKPAPCHRLRPAFGAPPAGPSSQQRVTSVTGLLCSDCAPLASLRVDLRRACFAHLCLESPLHRRSSRRLRPRSLGVPFRVALLLVRKEAGPCNPHGVGSD